MRMTIGEFLFRRMRELGIGHVFGVPGDFNLQLLEQIRQVDGIDFVGTCNELNASYAADGYARLNRIGALLTTYGVGDLSAVCGIAGACAEHVPIVFVSGVPPLYAIESRLRVHHSLAEGNFDNVLNCMKEFTITHARLTPVNAAGEIDRALLRCWRERMPVYLQMPSNISYLDIEVPDAPLDLTMPPSDPERLETAARRIAALLDAAARPLLLVDAEVDRAGFAAELAELVRRRAIPHAAFRTGKAILSEADPLFLGMYGGRASAPEILAAVEGSDCLIATAPCFVEASPMVFPAAAVYIRGFSVTIGTEVHEGIVARELVARVVELVSPRIAPGITTTLPPVEIRPDAPLTHAQFWPRIARALREGDVVIGENGTSNIALGTLRLPDGCVYVAQNIWGAIGYTLPAQLGTMMAAPDRRHVLFIGDGSIQLTVQELSTMLRLGLKPVIFVLNNRGYTIERYILGMRADYNDIADWRYADLPRVLAPGADVLTASIRTEAQLEQVLAQVEQADRACLIELHFDPEDAPEGLKTFGPMIADLDYGPRGPQRQV